MARDAKHNHLLAALPATEWACWQPMLEWIDLPLGLVVYESGNLQSHVYFPTTAIVSLLYVMESGASAEIAVVGNEGVVGISLFMGGESTPSRAVVESAGQGWRLKAQAIKNELGRSGPVMHLLLRYTQALITQMAQTAVCNRHHSLDQQLCRWLLLSKWTALAPGDREKHFVVIRVVEPVLPDSRVDQVDLQVVHSGRTQRLYWRELTDGSRWRQGWA